MRQPPEKFNDLDPQKVTQAFKQAYKAASDARKWPVYAFGDAGRGKSYAAAWAFCAFGSGGQNAEWHSVGQLVRALLNFGRSDDVSGTYAGRQCSSGSLQGRIADAAFCAFDDIGLREPSPAAYEILFGLVESRKGKPTIYTSNIAPPDLMAVYDSRIASRLLEGTWIQFTGEDRRLQSSQLFKV